MEQLFKEKVAIVTGGGSGIGQATVLYAQHKAKVIVSDINEKGGAETVSMIKANDGEATFVKADVSDAAACEALIKQTVQKYVFYSWTGCIFTFRSLCCCEAWYSWFNTKCCY